MTIDDTRTRCVFYVRTPATETTHTYTRIWLSSRDCDGYLTTTQPPAIGDQIFLYDHGGTGNGPRGEFRVVARSWRHASYGSTYWPYTDDRPTVGASLDIVVVPAKSLMHDQETSSDDEDEATPTTVTEGASNA
jgi:hypothetical protein